MAAWMYVEIRLNRMILFERILVTPPLKNVRKRRFRKVARQKTQDHDEIEKEVRRLFRYIFIFLPHKKNLQ
jgi:TATA-binding protein-associated factor Taf7